jgi:glycosyltransferase involved in cell wall biosynthesis
MISIIIPARNEEKIIAGTIEQFKSLTVPHEVIISDDGSTDRTVEIARSVADAVVTYSGEKHVIARARNAGARVARGEMLIFADSDAYLPDSERYVQHALKRFQSEPELVGIATPQRVRPEIERFTDMLVFGFDNLHVRFFNNVLHHGQGCGKLMFVRKSAFEKVGGFDERLIFREDADFMGRLSKIGKTRFDPKLTVYHSGRRLHRLGVLGFYWSWISNGIGVVFFSKARDKEWTPVR